MDISGVTEKANQVFFAIQEQQQAIAQVALGTFVCFSCLLLLLHLKRMWYRPKWFTWRRAKKMKVRARGEYIKKLKGDLITDAFEEAYHKNLWTHKEKTAAYLQIGRCCNLPDLIPKRIEGLHPAAMKAHLGALKQTLLNRRGVKERKVKLPGDDTTNVVPIDRTPSPGKVRTALSKLQASKK